MIGGLVQTFLSCGHCASMVAKTCKLTDPAAKVDVDIAAKRVSIESSEDRQDFAEALAEAGYPPATDTKPAALP